MIKSVWADIQAHNSIDIAAEMSFYFVLSLFPFLIIVAAIIGWLPSTNLWHNFVQWMVLYLPSSSRKLIFAEILDLANGYSGFFSFGLLGTLWTVSSGFTTLMDSLNTAYGVKETRGFWYRRAIACCATCLSAVFFIISFGLLALGHTIGASLALRVAHPVVLRIVFDVARWLVNVALMCLALDLINYFLPNHHRPWRWVTAGRLFVAVTFVIASIVFNLYIRYFANYPRVYGALAGFIVLMLWVYLGSLILLIGAEADDSLDHLKNSRQAA